MKRLAGKVAIVTGAGTGIGEAIAHKFSLEGAQLVLNGLPDDPVVDVAAAINERGGEAVAYVGDVSEELHAQACVQKALETYGKLDILINNAGMQLNITELTEYEVSIFDQLLRNNLRTAFLMTKHALPHLQKTRGNVVSAGSEAGFNGLAQNTPYGGTKGFIHSFMKGVAVEQAQYGVRANCVCPGPIDTAWTHKETGSMDKKMEKMLIQATPMGRRGTTEEIANVYAFLASDEASYVTGALWLVDGGVTVAKGPVGDQVPSELQKEPKGFLNLEHERDSTRG
ncbi:NAD(P)-dependent dehydrogenase, short-chain alcohol dehydrogenase family [Catalinimonas alkaloidigena]|uniref:NAD(P)-dependent dehydrogenase, short-chain alcohol dehydrogenase family n=1 Tax=Catalinimonas alkaloidigena TaxID=1075417 RepID=A0A1G8WCM7_9BACT|nr:SDR family oxidoreductase [Catalinimonas alkaloidigena]SDJ75961.1 NAD(P)-dependent dehydrogenase, short-chain alcohol dehydrogenase family [Catalinimonas alkaloidigena]